MLKLGAINGVYREKNKLKAKTEPTIDGGDLGKMLDSKFAVKLRIHIKLVSEQPLIEAKQFQGVARDVEELMQRKRSATIEQRVGDNLEGVSLCGMIFKSIKFRPRNEGENKQNKCNK
ncbi:hypothetical protein M9H77_27657 [Catharanthus roseus]|uniref:Uncharacterized protein n=1 Tax=Catharanthus roseus TaxID=4058 RepID=A0ACC0ADZ8_CATRO|nr:hypothetical protein M9H77_27657 [Catharanthus roseus]